MLISSRLVNADILLSVMNALVNADILLSHVNALENADILLSHVNALVNADIVLSLMNALVNADIFLSHVNADLLGLIRLHYFLNIIIYYCISPAHFFSIVFFGKMLLRNQDTVSPANILKSTF